MRGRRTTILLMVGAPLLTTAAGAALAKDLYLPGRQQDPCKGTRKADTITGTEGADYYILAGRGNDNVGALGGNDVVKDGRGKDYLIAGLGNDIVSGGGGAFVGPSQRWPGRTGE